MRSTSRIYTIITVGIIVAATGGAVWAGPPLGPVTVTASNPGDQFEPAVAWDYEHNQWLAVWEQDVSGERVPCLYIYTFDSWVDRECANV